MASSPPDQPGPGYKVHDRRWWSNEADDGDTAGQPARLPTFVARLESELADRDRRLAELGEKIRASEHEFAQSRARLEREAARELERRMRDGVADWLGAVDDLDRAIAAGRKTAPGSALLAGVELVRANLLGRLSEQGLELIAPTGQPFDPRQHDAIARVAVDHPSRDGVIAETVTPGYRVGEHLVRPARVVVGFFTPRG